MASVEFRHRFMVNKTGGASKGEVVKVRAKKVGLLHPNNYIYY